MSPEYRAGPIEADDCAVRRGSAANEIIAATDPRKHLAAAGH